MQLTYRGHHYNVSQPTHTAVEDTKKLVYRGTMYDYTPQLLTVDADKNMMDSPHVDLIYRGHTYTRQLSPLPVYQKPRVINWRLQTAANVA